MTDRLVSEHASAAGEPSEGGPAQARVKRGAPEWELRYARKLLATDIAVVVLAVVGAQFLRFGAVESELRVPLEKAGEFAITYTSVSIAIVLAWLSTLALWDSRKPTIFGTGPDEYKRVANATFATFGAFAILAYLFKAEIGRGYLLIALPAGLLLLLIGRWAWRKRLHARRQQGLNSYRVLVVGEREKVAHVVRQIQAEKTSGFDIIGAVTARGNEIPELPDVAVVADYAHLTDAVDALGVDSIIITSTDDISPKRLREIGWALESRKVDLVVTAALTDVAGPRIHMRPVSGLPLIHVAYPEFSGRKFFAKRMFDLVFSGVALVLLSPLFLVLALVVKLGSRGPVIFRQQRVGHGGKPFKMLKFRSMVVDAEARLTELSDANEGSGLLFKMKDDPRVTRSGKWMRRYSLDELPQFVNVFRGEMSLVGPRPPLPQEVEKYEAWVSRRLLVKPGITGLWQVSGRSNLSWDDSVRLDLYYVENWSLTGDMVLLWRTLQTVTSPEGAY